MSELFQNKIFDPDVCGKQIQIQANDSDNVRLLYFWNNLILTISQSVIVTVVDSIMDASYPGSDILVSISAFQRLANLSTEVVYGKLPAPVW